jgi:dienelactone hydrolase
VLVTEALRAVDGACIAPSPTLRALLAGDDRGAPALAGLPDRYAELLTRAGVPPEAVVGGTVFTTQSIVEDSVAIAEDIRGRAPTWGTPPTCVDAPAYRVCDGVFAAADYLEGLQAGFGPSPRPYDLPVRAYLPLATAEAPTPRPTVIFGHGLGSDRGQAAALAEFAVPLGMNVVSIDAPAHGDHPTAEGDSDIQRLAGFFGIDILEQRLDGLTLRDHWRQATYDKLQLVRLLALQGDLDADGVSDVDSEHIAYLGVSLGGIMGAELLALSPDVGLGVLSVPGGRVASIISDGPTFSILVRAMTPPGTPPGEVARFFPVLQTLIERGDAANYAPHVLGDRLPGAGDRAPHVLMAMAIDDTIVPNVCNRALARALGAPHVPPVLQTIGVVPLAEAAPVSGNRNDGRTTAGVFQFDRVAERPGEAPVRAEHDNLAKSVEGVLQATHFMETWITRGVPEIVDPYAELGTPPLPDAGSAR